jgi:hypothetical protein
MIKYACIILIVLILIFIFVKPSFAFDGERDGFTAGVSLGIDYNFIGEERLGIVNLQHAIAPAIGFTLGGISKQKHLMGVDFNLALARSNITKDHNATNLYFNIAYSYTYLLKRKAPCLFFKYLIGPAFWRGESYTEGVWNGALGIGMGISFGYEFKTRFFVRLGVSGFGNQGDYATITPAFYRVNGVIMVSLSVGKWAY